MKKIILLVLGMFFFSGIIHAENDKPIKVEQLPGKAQQFIKTYWGNTEVSYAKMEKELLETTYEVTLVNSIQIEFNKDGAWKEIKSKYAAIPNAVILKPIIVYVEKNYPQQTIKKITQERNYYEIELENELELQFDKKGANKRKAQ